jgi:hypothetical protein
MTMELLDRLEKIIDCVRWSHGTELYMDAKDIIKKIRNSLNIVICESDLDKLYEDVRSELAFCGITQPEGFKEHIISKFKQCLCKPLICQCGDHINDGDSHIHKNGKTYCEICSEGEMKK